MAIDTYKGVRDFYPEDERIQQYIYDVMSGVCESFGYEPYNASILEPTELYTAKTSEEIIKEQTYTFTDRGKRSVTLRPEMTPTVARMVAKRKRILAFPLRWYSIPNCFRYERPQKGRLREFWQLNVDLFGVDGIEGDAEIIELTYSILKAYGATDDMFEIKVADRALLETAFDAVGMDQTQKDAYRRLLDKKAKMTEEEFKQEAEKITDKDPLELILGDDPSVKEAEDKVRTLIDNLQKRGVTNVSFDPSIVRGFDYYTGTVFEVFDTSGDNPRSMFGGGRYDELVGEYGKESVPAVGVAAGDVIIKDFLETHDLLPQNTQSTDLYLAPLTEDDFETAAGTAAFLREKCINVALGMKHNKVADHIKVATKLSIPFFAVYGKDEHESGSLKIKNLETKEEETVPLHDVPRYIEG